MKSQMVFGMILDQVDLETKKTNSETQNISGRCVLLDEKFVQKTM